MPVISVIEISPTAVEMIICEKSKNKIRILENISEELNIFLGSEKVNCISFEKGRKLCIILNKMKALSKDYGVKNILTVTTSSFDTVKNILFILDQIKIKVGLDVEVFTNFEKKKLLFKKFLVRKKEIIPQKKNTMLLNIGSTTTDFFIINGKKLMINESISTGGYKFAELIQEHNLTSEESMKFIEEYVDNYLEEIKKEAGRKKIGSVILLGESENIFTGTEGELSVYSYDNLDKLVNKLKSQSFSGISKKFGTTPIQSVRTYARLCLLKYISSYFKISETKIFYYDTKYLMAYEHFFPKEKKILEDELWDLTIQAVMDKANKFSFHLGHSTFVRKFSKDFFEVLSPLHNMGENEKKYLELASYLHDIGKYINFSAHQKHSQYILTNSFIPGLVEDDLKIIGLLCRFHNVDSPIRVDNIESMESIPSHKQMDIMKLAAILKLTVSLDRSKNQKAKEINLKLKGDEIIVHVVTEENYRIETIFFEHQKKFFKDIFGINPVLKLDRRRHGE